MFKYFKLPIPFKKKLLSPVFIVGAPRSGTTWLWGMLTSHPKIEALVREDFDPNNPSVVDGKRITSETGAFINFDDQKITTVIEAKFKKHPSKTLIEKTPSHTLHIERILHLFPDAKVLHIIRDPRSVIASMLRSEFFNFADSPEDAIRQYRHYAETMMPYLKDSRVFTVRYEELKNNPHMVLTKIFNFIDLRISDNCLCQIIKENENVSKVSMKGVFRRGKVDGYKKDLSVEQIKKIEYELSDLINFFNF